jgi:hypothetical protein
MMCLPKYDKITPGIVFLNTPKLTEEKKGKKKKKSQKSMWISMPARCGHGVPLLTSETT